MTDPRTDIVGARRLATLWAGILIAPAAFAANLQLGYLLVHPACLRNDLVPLHVVQVLCLVAALGGGLIAWRALRRERARVSGEPGERGDRSRFMAGLGVWTSALFALVIVAQAVPSFVLHQCQ
jgi:hypothetical protein